MQDLAWYRSTYYAANLWLRKVSHIRKFILKKIQWPWARVYGDPSGPAGFVRQEQFQLGPLLCLDSHQRALRLACQVKHPALSIQRNIFQVGVGRIICKSFIQTWIWHGLWFFYLLEICSPVAIRVCPCLLMLNTAGPLESRVVANTTGFPFRTWPALRPSMWCGGGLFKKRKEMYWNIT